ncbi:MAG: hypothetical protein AAGA50_16810 [Pseudomonadota bacterium]
MYNPRTFGVIRTYYSMLTRIKWMGIVLGVIALFSVDEIPLGLQDRGAVGSIVEFAALWLFRAATVLFIYILIRSVGSGVKQERYTEELIARERAMKRGEDRFRDR